MNLAYTMRKKTIAWSITLLAFPFYIHTISSLKKNDPYPIFTTLDPHTFLHTQEKINLKAPYFAMEKSNSMGLGVYPFIQHADSGRDIQGNKYFPKSIKKLVTSVDTTTNACTTVESCTGQDNAFPIELGDITGRLNMIALMLGNIPDGHTLPPSLLNAAAIINPNETMLDPTQRFGHFSIPISYKKRGVRFNMLVNLLAGFGFEMEAGIACITQTIDAFNDLTCFAENECPFTPFPDEVGATSQPMFTQLKSDVTQNLMNQVHIIAQELGLNIGSFQDSSIDELRFSLFWRHAFELNGDRPDWPYILATPFFRLTGSFSPVKIQDFNKVFSVPFGNNRHTAAGLDVGLNFDFIETIEIGAEVGVTHFFSKDFCNYRVPTHEHQRVLFPFFTSVSIEPGRNWHFALKISAFHFIDKLSAHFQYVMIEHKEDEIHLLDPSLCSSNCPLTTSENQVFKPKILEQLSSWKSKVANIGLNYDISPNIALGLLWQAPLTQRNSYRTSTIALGLYATF